MTYGTFDFLLTGYIDTSLEDSMLRNETLDSDVEIPEFSHHGRKHATSVAFLAIISLNLGLVSVGEIDNGHAAPTELQRSAGDYIKVHRRT